MWCYSPLLLLTLSRIDKQGNRVVQYKPLLVLFPFITCFRLEAYDTFRRYFWYFSSIWYFNQSRLLNNWFKQVILVYTLQEWSFNWFIYIFCHQRHKINKITSRNNWNQGNLFCFISLEHICNGNWALCFTCVTSSPSNYTLSLFFCVISYVTGPSTI